MALIKCPDCGREFSDAAAACPNCGRPNKAAPLPEGAKKKTGCAAWAGLAVVVFVLIGIIGTLTPAGQGDRTTQTRDVKDYEIQATAEQAIKGQLRDPGSAEFQDVRVVHHQNGVAVCGQVNAKNGFGGFTGFTDFIYIQTPVIRTTENDARFVKIWNKSCR